METIHLPTTRSDTRSTGHVIFRTVGAVIPGLITWIFIATLLNLALRASWPYYQEAEIAFNFTFAMKLSRLLLGAISTLGAGFVAAWIDKGRMRAATLTAVVLLCLFIPGHYMIWNKFPVWYHLTFLLSLLPLTLLGAALNHRVGRKTA